MKRSIAQQSIFGEYKQGEDRVTAALLQILRIGGPDLMSHVFDYLDINVNIGINSQVKKAKSRPDGELKANYHLFIESKIKPWAVNLDHNREQLEAHVKLTNHEQSTLLYITVDSVIPEDIKAHSQVYWTNWKELINRLNSYQSMFNSEVISFLIAQFELLVENEVFDKNDGYSDDERVIIVGGRYAEGVAVSYQFYACQPNRRFRKAKYIAFYYDKHIQYVSEILDGPKLIKRLTDMKNVIPASYPYSINDNQPLTFFKLKDAEKLNIAISHNHRNAFVQRQRYTSIDKLRNATTTDDL